MVKRIRIVIGLLVISGNLFVFAYGLYQQFDAEKYLRRSYLGRAVNSGLVLALHDIEDSGKPEVSGDLVINNCKVNYYAKYMDPKSIYLKASAADGKDKAVRELIRNL